MTYFQYLWWLSTASPKLKFLTCSWTACIFLTSFFTPFLCITPHLSLAQQSYSLRKENVSIRTFLLQLLLPMRIINQERKDHGFQENTELILAREGTKERQESWLVTRILVVFCLRARELALGLWRPHFWAQPPPPTQHLIGHGHFYFMVNWP